MKPQASLSLNDVAEVCETFAAFDQVEVRTTYTISSTRNDPAGSRAELLISNWPFRPLSETPAGRHS